jgi:hypothetical protein
VAAVNCILLRGIGLNFLPNVDVEAPPLLKSDCAETEKLMGGCPLTPCSESSSWSGETDALPLPWSDWTGEGLRLHVFDGRGIAVGVVAEINGRMEIIGDRKALRESVLKVIPRLDEKNIVNDSMSNITKINGPEIRMCLNGLTILGESIVADDAVCQNTGYILPNFSFAHVKRL